MMSNQGTVFLLGFLTVFITILCQNHVESFSASTTTTSDSIVSTTTPVPSKIDRSKNPQWLDVLRYDGEPTFDVLQKTMEWASEKKTTGRSKYLDDDYVFRGPIVGPITIKDVINTQQGFQITDAYNDIETRPFGFTIDPDNPYRCYFMERWEGKSTGPLKVGPLTFPPTDEQVQLPTHTMSVNWTPEGKIIYACLSAPLDRWEGTTQGSGAVFGLLKDGGIDASGAIGDPFFRIIQRLGHIVGTLGRTWSVEEDIPAWWKSKARGADPNDM